MAEPRFVTAGEIQTDPLIFTNDEVLADITNPNLLIPEAGVGTIIIPKMAIISCDTTGGAYADVDGGFIFTLGDNAALNEVDTGNTANVLTSGDPETWIIPVIIDVSSSEGLTSYFENLPLMFRLDNSGAVSGGHASNFLSVSVIYQIANLR